MALTDTEIQRIRYELGYPNLETAAEPYIGIASVFEQVIQPYLLGGVSTTSSTPVTAATSPTPQTLTLASATGFAAGDIVVIDVDTRQERSTIQSLSGASMTVLLSLTHSGTYSVVQEGAEGIIRDILREIRLLSTGMNGSAGTISTVRSRVGLKKVDDVEFFGGGATLASQGVDPLTQILQLREYWRDELASALGIVRLNAKNASGGSEVSVY
jgi:bifunctional DNA-binding transcriptional regulator/antitoxin component of YhaV-PrlF toxin-antitoxin module